MTKQKTLQQEIVTSLLTKFPKAKSLTLARIAYRDNKKVFRNLESARGSVRYARGNKGKTALKHVDKEFVREPQTPGDPFAAFPEGKSDFENWESLQVSGRQNVLVLADIHIPFHDRPALLSAIEYGKKNGVDTVLLNGDTSDFFSVSFWEKDPRKRKFKEELETTKEFLRSLREVFPKARIIYKIGNHEERWERYMRVKAPEVLDVAAFQFEAILELAKYGIELVTDKRPVRLGELNVIHGHEYRFAISNPVSPARGLFLKCKAYALCGHFHQASYHTDKTVEQKVLATWSTGCLCDLHPEYMPMNNWCHGFCYVELFDDGKFNLQNKVIRNGKIY